MASCRRFLLQLPIPPFFNGWVVGRGAEELLITGPCYEGGSKRGGTVVSSYELGARSPDLLVYMKRIQQVVRLKLAENR